MIEQRAADAIADAIRAFNRARHYRTRWRIESELARRLGGGTTSWRCAYAAHRIADVIASYQLPPAAGAVPALGPAQQGSSCLLPSRSPLSAAGAGRGFF